MCRLQFKMTQRFCSTMTWVPTLLVLSLSLSHSGVEVLAMPTETTQRPHVNLVLISCLLQLDGCPYGEIAAPRHESTTTITTLPVEEELTEEEKAQMRVENFRRWYNQISEEYHRDSSQNIAQSIQRLGGSLGLQGRPSSFSYSKRLMGENGHQELASFFSEW